MVPNLRKMTPPSLEKKKNQIQNIILIYPKILISTTTNFEKEKKSKNTKPKHLRKIVFWCLHGENFQKNLSLSFIF